MSILGKFIEQYIYVYIVCLISNENYQYFEDKYK